MLSPEIYVNARFLTQPITGVQRFAIEISKQLKALIPDIKFVSPPGVLHPEIAAELEVILVGKYKSHVWEQFELPAYLKKKRANLLVNLANTAPALFRRNMVTIHDLAFKVNPGWFSKPFYIFYNWLIPKIAKDALHVFTVSEFSKQEIIQLLNISPDKITVAYNAVSACFSGETNFSPNYLKIPENYILSVASIDPRKNFICLIQGFQLLPDKSIKLCLIGRKNKVFADNGITALIQNNPDIIFMEDLPDKELALLYQRASLFVYASIYEGFGIPNLEAMASNCPVITSDIAVFKEICADAALYFNPRDSVELAEKITALLREPQNQQIMKMKGKKQAAKYSWLNSAKKYEDVIFAKFLK